MATQSTVTVIGSYAKAIVVTSDRIPVAGETLVGWDYRQTYGGKGSDMAVQAARLGAQVNFVGVVGEDQLGDEFVELLTAEGIDISGLRRTSEQPTGVGLIIKDTRAQNIIVVDMGANKLLSCQDIDDNAALFSSSGVALAQLEIPLETALYGLKTAKSAGMTTVLNPAPAIDLRRQDLRDVDIITPNETEARVILGLDPNDPISDEEIVQQLLVLGVGSVVITMGGHGVLVGGDDETVLIDPIDVEVVDTNGAGDSFNAGLATALAEGLSLKSAVSFAATVAGLCCQDWETIPSYKTRAEVEAFGTGKI